MFSCANLTWSSWQATDMIWTGHRANTFFLVFCIISSVSGNGSLEALALPGLSRSLLRGTGHWALGRNWTECVAPNLSWELLSKIALSQDVLNPADVVETRLAVLTTGSTLHFFSRPIRSADGFFERRWAVMRRRLDGWHLSWLRPRVHLSLTRFPFLRNSSGEAVGGESLRIRVGGSGQARFLKLAVTWDRGTGIWMLFQCFILFSDTGRTYIRTCYQIGL